MGEFSVDESKISALLLTAHADGIVRREEITALIEYASKRFSIDKKTANASMSKYLNLRSNTEDKTDLFKRKSSEEIFNIIFTPLKNLSEEEKKDIIRAMEEVSSADNDIHEKEVSLIEKAKEFLL